MRDILKSYLQIDVAVANRVELLFDGWLPHCSVVFVSRRESWIIFGSNFSLFDGVDVTISLNELFEKLINCWVVPSDFVVENDRRVEIAWVLETTVALNEKLSFKLSFE